LVNGEKDKRVEEVNRYGEMVQYMKDIGRIIKQMVMVD